MRSICLELVLTGSFDGDGVVGVLAGALVGLLVGMFVGFLVLIKTISINNLLSNEERCIFMDILTGCFVGDGVVGVLTGVLVGILVGFSVGILVVFRTTEKSFKKLT